MSDTGELYQNFFKVYKEAYPEMKGIEAQTRVNGIWKATKEKFSQSNDFFNHIREEVKKCEVIVSRRKTAAMKYFCSNKVSYIILCAIVITYYFTVRVVCEYLFKCINNIKSFVVE